MTGFGPFGAVQHNPTADLARAVDGAMVGGRKVNGVVLPVVYEASVQQTLDYIEAYSPRWVIGTGVAVRRERVSVERWGRRVEPSRPDVHGLCSAPKPGPVRIASTVDVDAFARALDGYVSDDAGTYVCNGWLYGVLNGCSLPVTFVHIPPTGMEVPRFLDALAKITGNSSSGDSADG